jgi:sporulation protein YlmC with PRC-barrel domain
MNDDVPQEMLAGFELLDRQLVDVDGYLAGKVDDLELDMDGGDDALPTVVAILSGPGALAGRVGGRFGRLIGALHRRLDDEHDAEPARVPFELVARIGEHVDLRVTRDELESNHSEAWARDVIVSKIPGARHEAE